MAEIRQIQVDGVNYDLVVSEDEVSATAAAQSAAQALAYKNEAQTSAAQAGQQATNASNQADRAEDAASRAEQIVGGEFLSYGGDQGLDFDQQDQARENIGKATFKSASGSLVNIEHAANIPLRTLTANIVPIQSGSGDPSPSNVRTISGWTGIKLNATGKNIWTTPTVSGTGQIYITPTSGNIPAGTYTISGVATSSDTDRTQCAVLVQYSDTTYGANPMFPRGTRYSYTFTADRPIWRIIFYASETSSLSTDDTFTFSNVQIEVGETATAYEAFKTTHSITFPSSAGTVYGGTLNVKTGVLTSDWIKWDLTNLNAKGTYTDSTTGIFVYYGYLTHEVYAANEAYQYCNRLKFGQPGSYGQGDCFRIFTSTRIVRMHIDSIEQTQEAYEAYLAANETYVVYKVASSASAYKTYQCTPTEVTALLGLNNIWADTGDVSLQYLEQGVLTEEYAKYEEERIPQITTKMFTNPNLLDNGWFTVRQRGDGSFSSSGYTVDMWKIAGGPPTITPLSGYGVNISQTINTAFDQIIDPNLMPFYNGKTLTLSVYTSAGIFTGTGVLNTSTSAYSIRFNLGTTGFRAGLYNATTSYWFARIDNITSGATINLDVYAVKLELGSVSTLANDAPSDYAEELMKCQYYFNQFTSSQQYGYIGIGIADTSTSASVFIPTPVAMKYGAFSLNFSGAFSLKGASGSHTVSNMATKAMTQNGVILTITTSGMTVNETVLLQINTTNAYLRLSAEL